MALLEKELKTYEKNKKELINKHNGKYVLIKDTRIVSFYKTQEKALAAGWKRFGHVPLFIKKVTKSEYVYQFNSVIVEK